MDWDALILSLELAGWTCLVLVPLAVLITRPLAWSTGRCREWILALASLPLVLPPTVLGYYLLQALGQAAPLGQFYNSVTGRSLVFSFDGLLLASLIFNLPFAVHPVSRAFEAIPRSLHEAAWCSGLSDWQTFIRIDLPLAWPGLGSALALCFAHTLGEFGVVLMMGGNLAGETRTLSIAIYDRMQALDDHAAGVMALSLLAGSFGAIAVFHLLSRRSRPSHE